MTKHTYTNDAWTIFPAIGIWIGDRTWALHVMWLRKGLVLTFKKKKNGARKSN